jgi:transposase
MTITTVGIDLAKMCSLFIALTRMAKPFWLNQKVTRAALPELIAGLPPCVIGMEACSGLVLEPCKTVCGSMVMSHDLMAAKFVSPPHGW